MKMINHTCTDLFYPLNISLSYGTVSPEDYLKVLGHYAKWLDREQPYALLNIRDDASFENSPGLGKMAKGWMQKYLPLLQQYEQGIALVVPESRYEKVCKTNFEAISAGACRVFTHTDEALAWLAEAELKSLEGFNKWKAVKEYLKINSYE